jgi:hypothetical protein
MFWKNLALVYENQLQGATRSKRQRPRTTQSAIYLGLTVRSVAKGSSKTSASL